MIISSRENLKYQAIKYGGDEASKSHVGVAVTDGESGGKGITFTIEDVEI